MRAAIYYAPELDDPLWRAGCAWLGRDPESGAAVAQPGVPDLPALTGDPRRYGFHATLKPPMRLRTPFPELVEDARRVAAALRPFELPALAVTELSGFLALCETAPCPALQAMSDACVVDLDRHRAPADADELARRRRHGLPAAEDAMLERWGYPHVLSTWRFHMTLSQRLTPTQLAAMRPAAEAYFAGLLGPRTVGSVCVYTEHAPGAPFLLGERFGLGG